MCSAVKGEFVSWVLLLQLRKELYKSNNSRMDLLGKKVYRTVGVIWCFSLNKRVLSRNEVIYFVFLTCFVNIECVKEAKCAMQLSDMQGSDLNLIVTERPPKTPSVSQHLEFISRIDKHKYSHIVLHKPPNRSYTPCCQRLAGLSVWDWLLGGNFCQQTVKTATWQHSISWRFEEKRRRLRSDSQPLRSPSSISVDISECCISCQNAVWKRATDTVLGCGKQIWMCLMLSGPFEKFQPKHE